MQYKIKGIYLSIYIIDEYLLPLKKEGINVNVLMGLLFGGIYYLTLIKGRSSYWGIDLNTRIGKKKALETLDHIYEWLFSFLTPHSQIIEVVIKMKNKGLELETISECTRLSVNLISEL